MNANNHNDVIWHKSTLSAVNGNCVEVAVLNDRHVGVRDSKDQAGPVLTFTLEEWKTFIGGVKECEFDL